MIHMMRENKAEKFIRILGIVFVILMLLIFILLNERTYMENNISDEYHIMDSNGNNKTVSDMEEYKFNNMKKDDWVEITCIVNNSYDYCNTLVFDSEFSLVEVFLDNKKVFENASSQKEASYINHTNYAPLGDRCDGKELKIKYTACDKAKFSNSGFICMEGIDGENKYLKRNIIVIGGALVFLFGGMLILIFEAFYHEASVNHNRIIINAAYCFVSGVWILTANNFMDYFCLGYDITYYIKYVAIYMSNALFLYYMAEAFHEYKKGNKLLKYMAYLQVVLLGVATVLNFTGIMSYSRSYDLYTIVNIVNILYLVYFARNSIIELIKNKISKFVLFIMVALIVIFGVLTDTVNSSYSIHFDKLLPLAMLAFNAIVFYGHIREIIRFYVSRAEHNSLEQLAYTDALTGIPNRNKCQNKLEEINNLEVGMFGIVLFDINGLKHINDTFGHTSGDELICAFANVLKAIFEGEGLFYGRMGGDEFIVITDEEYIDNIEIMMGKMKAYTDHINSTDVHKFSIKYSYGISICDRTRNNDIWKKIAQADANMYEMKK